MTAQVKESASSLHRPTCPLVRSRTATPTRKWPLTTSPAGAGTGTHRRTHPLMHATRKPGSRLTATRHGQPHESVEDLW